MQIFRKLDDIPAGFGPSIVSVGNFDGVHRAHVRVLNEIVTRAKRLRWKSVAVTFDPHPMRVLRPDFRLKLLTPDAEKLRLLQQTGIDATVVIPFSRDLSLLAPRDFVEHILCDRLHVRELHEGYNFRFGHKAAGDIVLLSNLGGELGFQLIVYPELRLRNESVSSTRIRELVTHGDVQRARALLGRSFSILSTAGRGRGYGSKYTVPTINLSHYDELTPRDGVYITRTRVAGECFDSLTNVGDRPTFGGPSFAIETHLLNFHPLDLTADTEIEISFLSRIRDEIKFSSVEELRKQIQIDIARAQHYFGLLQRTRKVAEMSR
ncbi:MAG TPA: bifunctional riboflavin kinase/FAD synthetase [Terriglobales bacterium]|nr:bifunctional riboflavin kinase/FAD synthetase [Terriglobales bacterium]